MTDDSKAEKNALKSLWPTSKQFLCHFHMAQAEWRWLHDNKNGIKPLDRLPLMRKFQKVRKIFLAIQTTTQFKYLNKNNKLLKAK